MGRTSEWRSYLEARIGDAKTISALVS
ncbi:hypothetical protein A2U01_0062187, partial [Trifolium medium]|nr:hypothetical protein [Trifolium medium]